MSNLEDETLEQSDEIDCVGASSTDDYEFSIAGTSAATSNKAIVVIPGVGGSVLRNSSGQACWLWLTRLNQLSCTTSGVSNNKITAGTGDYGVLDYYKPLCNMLKENYGDEYDVLFFPYDWRLSNASAATSLAIAINNSYDEVILVAHSMGGLVASKYLANSSVNRNKVDKLITLGTPYTGTPQLIYVAETGDFHDILSVLGYEDDIKDLVQNFHCTYQLAPTIRYANNYGSYIKSGTTKYSGNAAREFYSNRPWAKVNGATKTMYSSATTFHSGLIVSGEHIANSNLVDTYKIVGIGEDTASLITYDANGTYTGLEVNNSGDGTVPRYSASNTQAISATNKVYTVSTDHMGLIDNSAVFSRIKTIIGSSTGYSMADNVEDEFSGVNEKGWLIGADNARTCITLDVTLDITISDKNGNDLSIDLSGVYDRNGDKVGSVWILGNNCIKYIMRDSDYNIKVSGNNSNKEPIVIEYQNDGYYLHSETYSNISEQCLNISISDANEHVILVNATCDTNVERALAKVIPPSHVMTEEELIERNA
jgi:pimeloyl-ACP methyl ester carboxylesterase